MAHKNLGYALYKNKQYEKSIESYHTAIDKNNTVKDAYEHLSKMLQNECKTVKYIQQSLIFLEKVSKNFPEN